jgi:TetR/AcrR family transcriptional regulator, cholesterol catabolism regulator
MDRDTILEAAATIFGQKGYHAASMQDIADAVSLQKASLYYHVSSKQDILIALLDKALDILIERLSIVKDAPLVNDKKLRLAMETYLGVLLDHRSLASVLLLEYRSLDPHLKSSHMPRRHRFEGIWRGIIEDGIKEGIFSPVDPGLTARALLGLMNWTIMWYREDGSLSPKDIAEKYWKLAVSGLKIREKNGSNG